MAYLTNFSPLPFFYEIFREDASLLLLYHGAKKSKMTKTQIKGGGPAFKGEVRRKMNFTYVLGLGC